MKTILMAVGYSLVIEKDSNFTKYEDLGVNQKQTAEFLHRN